MTVDVKSEVIVVDDKRSDEDSENDSEDEVEITDVECLPFDVDGDCSFRLAYDSSKGKRMKSSIDGRNWERYNKNYTTAFNKSHGLRLRANCRGSFKCKNQDCGYLVMYQQEYHIQVKGSSETCKCEMCGTSMQKVLCPAKKIWEFPKESDMVTVHHTGLHTCPAIKKQQIPPELVMEFKENPSVKPAEATTKLMMSAVRNSNDVSNIRELAFNLSDERRVRNAKQKVTSESQLKGLADLQLKCVNDFKDPYMLFEYQVVEKSNQCYNVQTCRVEPSSKTTVTRQKVATTPEEHQIYVLKSSKERVELMRETMAGGKLEEEWIFMDAKHNRVKGKGLPLKTMGLSTYHPLLQKVVWLVRMDCEKEDEATVALFLHLIDEMLGQPFIPNRGFMTDEAGGIHAALKQKFGAEYDNKVVTCRFHLQQCAARHAKGAFLGAPDKDEKVKKMKDLVNEMVFTPTVTSYFESHARLISFFEESGVSSLKKWLEWWDRRRNHVMEAFRVEDAPNTNLAEVSHSSMAASGGSNLSILEAAVYDSSDSFKLQVQLRGCSSSNIKVTKGRGKSLPQRNLEKEQKECAKSKTLIQELVTEGQSGHGGPTLPTLMPFQPNRQSSHRADKGKGDDHLNRRPSGRRRTLIGKTLRKRMDEAKKSKYRISRIDISTPTNASVCISDDESDDFYVTEFDQAPYCSCSGSAFLTTQYPCVHRLFILYTIETLEDTLIQSSYSSDEIRAIIQDLHNYRSKMKRPATAAASSAPADPSSTTPSSRTPAESSETSVTPAAASSSSTRTGPSSSTTRSSCTPTAASASRALGGPSSSSTTPSSHTGGPPSTPPSSKLPVTPATSFVSPQNSSTQLKLTYAQDTDEDPYYVVFLTKRIKKCYGCDQLFADRMRQPPYNMIIQHNECRPKYDNKKWYVTREKRPAYYHLKDECIKTIHPNFCKTQVVMQLDFQTQATPEHMDVLGRAKFL